MQLRKALTLGSAVLAAGLLSLTATATASNPTGGPTLFIGVEGPTTSATIAIDGVFRSGTATFGFGTFGCTGGTVAGNVARGPIGVANDLSFTTLNIVCATVFGINATISVKPGCLVAANFRHEPNVHDGTVDTGPLPGSPGAKFNVVGGVAVILATCAAKLTLSGGICTAEVSGVVAAFFDEAVTTVGGVNYQDLVLRGTGLTIGGGSGICSLLNGGFTLNAIDFGVRVTSGTTTGIDFRRNP